MTPTLTADVLALYAACHAHPDDDTPRLILADALEEQGGASVPCPKCGGSGKTVRQRDADLYQLPTDFGFEGTPLHRCRECRGTRTVPDTSNRDRAELIRLQCRRRALRPVRSAECAPTHACTKCGTLWRLHPPEPAMPKGSYSVQSDYRDCRQCCDNSQEFADVIRPLSEDEIALLARERQILDLHGDRWRRAGPCARCHGKGELQVPDWHPPGSAYCDSCFGTGDRGGLLLRHGNRDPAHVGTPTNPWLHRVEYVRGFPRVHCRLADVAHQTYRDCPDCDEAKPSCQTCHGNTRIPGVIVPTAWAKAVLAHNPDCGELWLDDREPADHPEGAGVLWFDDGPPDTGRAMLPAPLFRTFAGLPGYDPRSGHCPFPTADAARVALARRAAAWVRGCAQVAGGL